MNQSSDMIPLAEAVLCQSCNVITRAKNHHCPACDGSGEALVTVASLLNRTERFGAEGVSVAFHGFDEALQMDREREAQCFDEP